MNRFWMFLGHAILGPNAAHLGTDRSCFSWPVQTIKAKNKKKKGGSRGWLVPTHVTSFWKHLNKNLCRTPSFLGSFSTNLQWKSMFTVRGCQMGPKLLGVGKVVKDKCGCVLGKRKMIHIP